MYPRAGRVRRSSRKPVGETHERLNVSFNFSFVLSSLISPGPKPTRQGMSEHAEVERPSLRADVTGMSSDLTLSDLARPRIRGRSALLVALAVGFALFVLVASAFSVAAESRVVATKSNQLHACDEILRSAITVRSQLGSAMNFAQLDLSQNTDSSQIIDAASPTLNVRCST